MEALFMKISTTTWLMMATAGITIAVIPATATAQLTTRNVTRIISPYAAGGGREVLARAFVNEFGAVLGENIIVENRPGAGSVAGTIYASRATPDGKTLLMTGTNHNIAPLRSPKPPYDPIKGFAPVGTIAIGSNVLMASASAPFRTVPEMVAYAKANPGKLDFSSAGQGSASHLTMAYLMGVAGIQMTHIPFKGSSAAAMDMLAGRVQLTFVTAAEVRTYLQDSRVRVLGVASPRGSKFLPGIPSLHDAGLKGFSYESWWGMLAPAGTPAPVVQKLNAALGKALSDPAVVERLAKLTVEPRIMTPKEFTDFLVRDLDTALRLLKTAGLYMKPEEE
jgi:tripartite-type tricarboxylate transporter receptor subunit TctC